MKTLWDLVLRGLEAPDLEDAFVHEVDGEICTLSRHSFHQHTLSWAPALKECFAKGEMVGLVGTPSPLWMTMDLALQGAGCVVVPFFPNQAPEILAEQIHKAGLSTIIALDDTNTFDWADVKIERILGPSTLSIDDPRYTEIHPRTCLIGSQGEFIQLWEELSKDLASDDVATLIFTSGSTGEPKGVPLTHGHFLSQLRGCHQRFPLGQGDRALSFLPLAHVFERMVSWYYLYCGITIAHCPDSKELGRWLPRFRPTIMTTVPRLLEKVQTGMSEAVSKKSSPQKELGRWALQLALSHDPHERPALSHWAADRLVFGKLRDRLGGELKMLISGGAPLSHRLCRFFNNIGVPTYQGYGLTECSPVLAANHPGDNVMGSVGPIFPEVEIRIDPVSREILAKGPGVFPGYHEEDTPEIDGEGWFHTGDLGELGSDGHLFIRGRKKELLKTSNGKYVSPAPIEERLRVHSWVNQALIIAEGHPYVTAFLAPDFDRLPEKIKLLLGSDHEESIAHLCGDLQDHIDEMNTGLQPWERVQKFRWLTETLTVEGGELTPTMKVKRHIIEKRLDREIAELYGHHRT